MARRFIPLTEVSEILDISSDQAYALVRSGDLPAIKVGGRGQWRVETVELEAYIQRMYARTREMVEPEQRSLSRPPRSPTSDDTDRVEGDDHPPEDIFGPPSLGQVMTGQLEGVGMDDVDRPGRPATSSVDHFHGSPVARELAQD